MQHNQLEQRDDYPTALQVLCEQFKKHIKGLECIQKRPTKLVKGLEGTSYEREAKDFGLVEFGEKGGCGARKRHEEGGAEFLSLGSNDRAYRNTSKMCQGRF